MPDESTPVPKVHWKDDGIRPAGPPDERFYCHAKVGNPHAQNCVAVKKVVRMRFVVEIDTEQPFSWTNEHIEEFEKHEGYCLQNMHLAPVISCHVVRVIDPGPTIAVRPDTMTHKGHIIEVLEPQRSGAVIRLFIDGRDFTREWRDTDIEDPVACAIGLIERAWPTEFKPVSD